MFRNRFFDLMNFFLCDSWFRHLIDFESCLCNAFRTIRNFCSNYKDPSLIDSFSIRLAKISSSFFVQFIVEYKIDHISKIKYCTKNLCMQKSDSEHCASFETTFFSIFGWLKTHENCEQNH